MQRWISVLDSKSALKRKCWAGGEEQLNLELERIFGSLVWEYPSLFYGRVQSSLFCGREQSRQEFQSVLRVFCGVLVDIYNGEGSLILRWGGCGSHGNSRREIINRKWYVIGLINNYSLVLINVSHFLDNDYAYAFCLSRKQDVVHVASSTSDPPGGKYIFPYLCRELKCVQFCNQKC